MLLRLQLPLLLWLQLPLLFVPHSIAGWPWYYSPVVRPWRLHPMPLLLPFLDGSSDLLQPDFAAALYLTSSAARSRNAQGVYQDGPVVPPRVAAGGPKNVRCVR